MKHLRLFILFSLLIAWLVTGCSADPSGPPSGPPSAADAAQAVGKANADVAQAAAKASAAYCEIPFAERQAAHAMLQASVRELRAVPYIDPCPAFPTRPAPVPDGPQTGLSLPLPLPVAVADHSECQAARLWPRTVAA